VGSFYVYVGLLHAVADYVGYGERDGVESSEGQVVSVGVMVLWLFGCLAVAGGGMYRGAYGHTVNYSNHNSRMYVQ
jgi:hypothetical protein